MPRLVPSADAEERLAAVRAAGCWTCAWLSLGRMTWTGFRLWVDKQPGRPDDPRCPQHPARYTVSRAARPPPPAGQESQAPDVEARLAALEAQVAAGRRREAALAGCLEGIAQAARAAVDAHKASVAAQDRPGAPEHGLDAPKPPRAAPAPHAPPDWRLQRALKARAPAATPSPLRAAGQRGPRTEADLAQNALPNAAEPLTRRMRSLLAGAAENGDAIETPMDEEGHAALRALVARGLAQRPDHELDMRHRLTGAGRSVAGKAALVIREEQPR